MAGESCVLKPSVRNKNGEEVESRLFKDLLQFSSNDREFAKKNYFLGTNEKFIDTYRSQLKFDDNGEVTFNSLKKVLGLDVSDKVILDKLNEEIGQGEYEYDKALSLANSFNSTHDSEYIAIVGNSNKGKATIEVVKNTPQNRAIFEQSITNRELFDRIKDTINSLGGDVTFIDEDYSVYDTQNAMKLSNGLYSVIRLSKSGNMTQELAHEAGHFAVGALGNNPLASRLESLMTPEVQKSIFGENYDGPLKNREAAGRLVGKYILGEVDKKSTVSKLAGRLIDLAKRMFYRMADDSVSILRLDAERAARRIAEGFYAGEGSIQNALSNPELEYSRTDSVTIRNLKDVLNNLSALSSEMGRIDKGLYRKWKDIEADTAIGRLFENPSTFADWAAIDGITNAMQLLADASNEIVETLENIDPNDTMNLAMNAKNLRIVETYVKYASEILAITARVLEDDRIKFGTGSGDKSVLLKTYNALNSLVNGKGTIGIGPDLANKQRKLFLTFMSDVYGKDYIERAERVIFDKKTGKIEKTEGEKVSLEDILDNLEEDDGYFRVWFASAANSSDAVNQIAYLARTSAAKIANDDTIKAWDDLRAMHTKFKEQGIDTNKFLEISAKTNKLTGNYISEYNIGDWEDSYNEMIKKVLAEFKAKPENQGLSRIEKEYKFTNYCREPIKNWHKANSVYDKVTGMTKPNDSYLNPEYSKLSDKEKVALNEVLDFKESLDDLLIYQSATGEMIDAANTHKYRMPQFRGSTNNRVENLKRNISASKATRLALRDNLVKLFTENSEDRDYGSLSTYNDLYDDPFMEESEKNKLGRVPLYGINKLENTDELTTDIFNGLLQYAAMANNFTAVSQIVDVLEVGRKVLEGRDKKREIKGKDKTSRVSKRYDNFLNAQVYNIFAPREDTTIGRSKVIFNKIANVLNAFGSGLFLKGNVAGAIVNLGTGFVEILKESVAGETYNTKDWWKANKLYWEHLPHNMMEIGADVKNNKISLFMRYFNVQNNMEEEVHNFSTRKKLYVKMNPFGEGGWLPYKTGDHYMQCMSYLAASQHIKVVDRNGNTKSLWDAMKVVPIDASKPNYGSKIEIEEGTKVKNEDGTLRDWGKEDEIRFENLCRETNVRMHGIYNKMDKTRLHNGIFSNMLLSMKGYALGMAMRRFSTNAYNISLGREAEGSIITLAKVTSRILGNPKTVARAIFLPFGNDIKREVLNMGFSASQYANLRRNWMDGAMALIIGMLATLTAKGEGEDEDDDKFFGLLNYFTSRLYLEQAAFNMPWEWLTEYNNFTKLVPSGISAVGQILDILWMAVTDERYKTGENKDESKALIKASRYIPYYRSVRVYEDPYRAIEAYEFGRATK